MATVASVAIRRANATSRIEAASEALGRHFGVSLPPPVAAVVRDPALRLAAEQERMAEVLEGVGLACGAIRQDEPVNLKAMKRDDLNLYALDHGVDDPEAFPNKDALITAIENAGQSDDGTNEPAQRDTDAPTDDPDTGVEIEQDGTPVVVTEPGAD